jgi:hypothetical protein
MVAVVQIAMLSDEFLDAQQNCASNTTQENCAYNIFVLFICLFCS